VGTEFATILGQIGRPSPFERALPFMGKHQASLVICACGVAMGVQSLGCVRIALDDTAPAPVFASSKVLLVATDLLDPPAVGTRHVYTPAYRFPVDQAGRSLGEGTGFFLTVSAADPDALRVRLVDRATKAATALVRVEPPRLVGQDAAAAEPRPLTDEAWEHVRRGSGVFWIADELLVEGVRAYRLAVLIPESLLPAFARLEVYASQGFDGTPLGAAGIELVGDFFYMANLGDSVQWGNGLAEPDKISTLVSRVIERKTGRRVILQRLAQSGATIVPQEDDAVCAINCSGEVPTARTSITAQVDLIQRPELMDLVLMDGCITDVDIVTITDPASTDEDIAAATQRYCGEEMAELLRKVRAAAPRARIVVTGYFPFIGPESDIFALRLWSRLQGFDADLEDEELLAEMTAQSILFRDVAHESLRAAVETINTEAGSAAVAAFADAGFGPERAMFSPDRWLFSMTADTQLFGDVDIDLPLFPEDPMQFYRFSACFEPDVVDPVLSCLFVSVGHPNPAGAHAYADAVVDQLRFLGVID